VRPKQKKKDLVGVDVFVHWSGSQADELGKMLKAIESEQLKLKMITNRGIKVWPNGFEETFCTDHWRCRFVNGENFELSHKEIIQILQNASEQAIDVIKTENLYQFEGIDAFSMGQGQ
jgi:isocitrate dehydrogenase